MNFATPQPAFRFREGTRPLLLSIPHAGTFVPPDLLARFTPEARRLPDTDWHLERLYDFADALGASVLVATHSRYVVDLNRPPDDQNLYPGQDTTGLCPIDTFDREPLYAPGQLPDAAEIRQRVAAVWQPYHDCLAHELQRLKQRHGSVLLWDAHSIRSVVPRFFEGTLPTFNLGTADGASCPAPLAAEVLATAQSEPHYTAVLNGRFKGGYITRRYGAPAAGCAAIQLEMAQVSYMHETHPFEFAEAQAERVRPVVRRMVERALEGVIGPQGR